MPSITDFQDIVFDYLAKSIDQSVLTRRVAELLCRLPQNCDCDTVRVAGAIESLLGEAITGLITKEELQAELAKQVTDTRISPEFKGDESSRLVRESAKSMYENSEVVFH